MYALRHGSAFKEHSDEQMMNASALADKAIRALGSQLMVNYKVTFRDFCEHSIVVGQRWVREQIYYPRFTGQDATYHRFHAELLEGQKASRWERHLDRDKLRTIHFLTALFVLQIAYRITMLLWSLNY